MIFNYTGMILAAGFGKRMLPLTENVPKPLIEINGVTLLGNAINFLTKLGCNKIIINTHYKHSQIINFINHRDDKKNIQLIYEDDILDTGGGVKNAIPLFLNENILVINSDIYWQNDNIIDAKLLIELYFKNNNTYLLLSKKNNSFGMKKKVGDFIIKNNNICRFIKGDEIIYYTGMQMLHTNILKNFNKKKFSFNEIWDKLIQKKYLFGKIMNSKWYHVGDISGLNIARKLDT